jgi:competence ComEA-like helix-hairpin-helix protein
MVHGASKPVNINTASTEELSDEGLGIGPLLAERIVAYRDAHGPFSWLSDLAAVDGISPGWLQKVGPLLTVGQAPDEDAWPPSPRAGAAQGEPESAGLEQDLPELARVIAQSEELEEPDMSAIPHSAQKQPELQADKPTEPPFEPGIQPAPETLPDTGAPPPTTSREQRSGRGRSALLVGLGALGGAVLTLVILVLWSGTLSFAPRREFDALNRNVDTMQRNQEAANQRADDVATRVANLEQQTGRLNAMEGRLTQVEASLGSAQSALAGVQGSMTALGQRLETLRTDLTGQLDAVSTRVGQAEQGIAAVTLSLDEVQKSLAAVDERVTRIDAFFGAVRDLLADLEPNAAGPATGAPAAQ